MTAARILVVEDDRIVARDIQQQLVRLGYAVAGSTARGDAAADLVASSGCDLVLMDVRLEGPVDGIEAAAQIRERFTVPVVFLTAYADQETLRRASLAEPFGFVLKPFEDSQLDTVIGMALYKHASEQRLRDSERKYASMLASIGDAVISTDEKLSVNFMNPAAEALTGWQAAEATGLQLSQVFCLLDDQGAPLPASEMAQVLFTGTETTHVGLHLMSRDGRSIMIDDTASPINDGRDNITGIALVFRDVTARRQAEDARALSELDEWMKFAVRGSNIGVWELKMPTQRLSDGAISLINVWEHLGYADAPPPAAALLLDRLFDASDVTSLRTAAADYLSGRSPRLELESRVNHANGSDRWLLIRGIAMRDAAGRAFKLIGTCVDITDQTIARQALSKGEQRWKGITEALPHLIWTVTAEGVSDYFSPQCYEYLGVTEEELTGMGVWLAHLHPDDRDLSATVWMAAFESKGRFEVEMRMLRHDGVYRWFESVGVPMYDADGVVTRWFGTSTDIDARKQAEAAMLDAKLIAESASRAKNRFLAHISHELRTPLNGILGYAQILQRDGLLNEKQRDGVMVIEQSGDFLLALINDILDFSRIEARRLDLELSVIELDKFLRIIVDIMRMRARENGLELGYQAFGEIPYAIRADERRLRQILLNLLANAVRFTDRGGVQLIAHFRAPNWLRFDILDTGIGIPASALETIFEPFEQAGDLPRRTGGAGLGLTISRQLVRIMGAEIQVESEVAVGSRFWFELSVDIVQGHPVSLAPHPSPRGYQGRRRCILIADDVKANRDVATEMLDALGFLTLQAENGAAVLAMLAEHEIDLVLMDAVMPIVDGIESVRQIRADPRYADLPVIAVSANVSRQNRERCIEAGANVFLHKPINLGELVETIRALLDLNWDDTLSVGEPAPLATRALYFSAASALYTLHQLALEGNMRAIVAQAPHLADLDPRNKQFATDLAFLARGFQSRGVLSLIEQAIAVAKE